MNGRFQLGTIITLCIALVSGSFVLGMHIGNGDVHQTQNEKMETTRQLIHDETDHMKELLLEKLTSIDRRLTNLEQR